MIFKPSRWYQSIYIVCIMALTGCKPTPKIEEDIRPVKFAVLQNVQQHQGYYAGIVQAGSESILAFRVSGKVVEKKVQAGEAVSKGQVLAVLEADDYILGQTAKQAQLMAMQSDAEQQKIELIRIQHLRAQNFVSQAQLDRQINISKLVQERYRQAQAEYQLSTRQRGYTQLIADKDGVISFTQIEAGSLVQAGQSVMRLASSGQKSISFDIADNDLEKIRKASHFQIQNIHTPNLYYTAKLKEITGDADPITRTYRVKLNLETEATNLALGQSVKIWLPQTTQANTRIPLSAVLDESQRTYVWVIQPKTQQVKKIAIKVMNMDESWAYIDAPIALQDKIVTAGVHLLRPNQKVKLMGAEEVKHAL